MTVSGYTLLEVMFAMALSVTLGAVATPQFLTVVDDVRAAGAVRYVVTRLQHARMEAVVRSTDVGVQFSATARGYTAAIYRDGNRNGIRTDDIQSGTDPRIGSVELVSDLFLGVDFGTLAGLPAVDPSGTPPGTDPIRLGSSNILTFTPLGTATSGSLYLRGRRHTQYVIRISGETGKVRVLKFDPQSQRWKPS